MIDAAEMRSPLPPQSIQCLISNMQSSSFRAQEERCAAWPAGWAFPLGTSLPVSCQSVGFSASQGGRRHERLCSTLLAFSRLRLGLLGDRVCVADQSGKRESPAEFSAGETAAKLLPSFSGGQWTREHCVGSKPSCHRGAFQRS